MMLIIFSLFRLVPYQSISLSFHGVTSWETCYPIYLFVDELASKLINELASKRNYDSNLVVPVVVKKV